jgi:hypothetical protein
MSQHKETHIPSQPTYIPFIKITPSYMCGYYQYVGPKLKISRKNLFTAASNDGQLELLEKEKRVYTGEITPSARKKLQSACDILFALAKKKRVTIPSTGKSFTFRIALVTLTLSGKQGTISDREIKKELLEPFLRHFRIRGMFNYIWKAERQQNGNIHFHILTDSWVDKDDCRDYWNKLQSRLGFIEQFHDKYHHRHPNSTDVKSVKDDNGMKNYMLKYMLKKVDKATQLELGRSTEQKDVGKVWDCSLNLKTKNETAEPIEDSEFELISEACDYGNLRMVQTERCVLYFPVGDKIWNVAPEFISKRLKDFLRKVREKGKEKGKQDSAPAGSRL